MPFVGRATYAHAVALNALEDRRSARARSGLTHPVRSPVGFVRSWSGFHGYGISLLYWVRRSQRVYGGPAPNPEPLTVHSNGDQASVLSVSRVVDVVAKLEIFDHSESLKQTLDRLVGNEKKADVIGLGMLACVIQYDDALGAEEIHCA